MKIQACKLSELQEKKPYTIRLGQLEVGVVLANNAVYAFENRCSHMGGPVCLGEVFGRVQIKLDDNKMEQGEYVDEQKLGLVCPWHGYEFDIHSGECVADPKYKIRKFATDIRDGFVFVNTD